MLERAKRVPMSKAKVKQPVLNTQSEAYWVDGDTGLKKTSKADWKNVTMTAEELAVIVPIPDALIDDSDVPLWNEIKPLIVEAIGKKVDQAPIFGTEKPDSWPEAIVPASIAAQNVGITSACAEKRRICWLANRGHRNYLRMRGEESNLDRADMRTWELPPHARRRG